jgi:hypothetical protein
MNSTSFDGASEFVFKDLRFLIDNNLSEDDPNSKDEEVKTVTFAILDLLIFFWIVACICVSYYIYRMCLRRRYNFSNRVVIRPMQEIQDESIDHFRDRNAIHVNDLESLEPEEDSWINELESLIKEMNREGNINLEAQNKLFKLIAQLLRRNYSRSYSRSLSIKGLGDDMPDKDWKAMDHIAHNFVELIMFYLLNKDSADSDLEEEKYHINKMDKIGNPKANQTQFSSEDKSKGEFGARMADMMIESTNDHAGSSINQRIRPKLGIDVAVLMPSDTPFLDFTKTEYSKLMKQLESDDITLEKAIDDLKKCFEGFLTRNMIEDWIDNVDDISNKEAEESASDNRTTRSSSNFEAVRTYNIVSMIWTTESNIYKWINKALFLDVLQLLFDDDVPDFFELAFKKSNNEFYKDVIKHSAKYMHLLNSFIEDKSSYWNSDKTLYRGMKISAYKDFDQDMVFRFINYQSCSKSLEVVFDKFIPGDSKNVSLYGIHKPIGSIDVAEICNGEFGMSFYGNEQEFLIKPQTPFKIIFATDKVNRIDDEEVKLKIKKHLKKENVKTKKITFWQLEMVVLPRSEREDFFEINRRNYISAEEIKEIQIIEEKQYEFQQQDEESHSKPKLRQIEEIEITSSNSEEENQSTLDFEFSSYQ